ncbi:MAG: hypothetical protein V1902_01315 [Candidatus Falkowbacteria bacterium]
MQLKNAIFQISLIVGVMILFVTLAAQGADSGTVTASVTAQNVSLTVSDGTLAFGTLAANSVANSCANSDQQTVTNNGNVNEDFAVKVVNPANWTLGASAASEVFTASYKVDGGVCPATTYAPPTAAFVTSGTYIEDIKAAVATSGTFTLDVGINTPTSTSTYTAQSIVFTVLATAS